MPTHFLGVARRHLCLRPCEEEGAGGEKKLSLQPLAAKNLVHARTVGIGIAHLLPEAHHLGLELLDDALVCLVVNGIVILLGIHLKVEKLPRRRRHIVARTAGVQGVAIDKQQLVAVGAHAYVRRTDIVLRPIAVIDASAPVGRGVAQQVLAEAAALRAFGSRGAGIVGKGGGEIDVEDKVGIAPTGRYLLGIADDKGHTGRLFIKHALVEPAVLAEEIALVGDIHHDGIVGDAELVEGVEQTAYVVVDGGAATQIVADEFLIGCLAGRHPAHACRIEG